MRWASERRGAQVAGVLALAIVCACGNLSNEDIAFLEAIPRKPQLEIQVPRGAQAQPLCAIGSADVYASAKTTGESINAAVDGVVGLVDAGRAGAPTTRDEDSRTWGPFDDGAHPGVRIRVTMARELDRTRTPWRWIYSFAAARPPGDFLPILEGEFFGAQARNGIGRLVIHFENSTALAINKPGDPTFPGRIFYDLSSEPRTVSLDLTSGNGFGLLSFDYAFAGYADGHGQFDYAFPDRNNPGCITEVTTFFTAEGAGRDVFRERCPLGIVIGDVQQCWDATGCLGWVDDPFALTPACNGVKPCTLGSPSRCPPGL